MNIAVVVAAGKGTRMGASVPKQMLPYRGSSVLMCALRPFAYHDSIDALVIVAPADGSYAPFYEQIAEELRRSTGKIVRIVPGGAERGDSVQKGLQACAMICETQALDICDANVLIHDGARADISVDVIDRNLEALETCKAVCTAVPAVDSIRINKSDNNLKSLFKYPIMNSKVVPRERIFYVQTPQSFHLQEILTAYRVANEEGYIGTDDASIAEYAGIPVALVEGSYANRKITTKEDVKMGIRVGNGYDVHRLVSDRALLLCGTPVPSKLGLLGHSDADVATHALMDALLGAAARGDIGKHFPDTDEKYRGANSMTLLKEVRRIISDYDIVNVDLTIICERPKLAPYIETMRQNIADTLEISVDAVSVKATTTEKLGFTGREEGIAALATCVIEGR